MRLPMTFAIAAAALLGTPMFASGVTADSLAKKLIEDRRVASYLGMDAVEPKAFDSVTLLKDADLNKDGLIDPVVMVKVGSSVVIGAFIASKDAEPAYAGSIRLDASILPSAVVCDMTGDGASDLRVEFLRNDQAGRQVKSVAIAGLVGGKLIERFRSVIDDVERSGIYQRRSEHLIRVEDMDGDSQFEIEISSKQAELLTEGGTERELAGSVTATHSIYRLKEGRYVLDRIERIVPTDEMRLEAAMELLDAGAIERASQIAVDLSTASSIMKTEVTERATALLRTVRERTDTSPDTVATSDDVPGAPSKVAATTDAAGPDTPASA